jgi:hypothetical protein
MLGGLIIGVGLRSISGAGLLAFLIATAGIIIGLLIIPSGWIWDEPPSGGIVDRIVGIFYMISIVIGLYFNIVLNNSTIFYLFLALDFLSLTALHANKARLSSGAVRRYYLGSTTISFGPFWGFLGQAFFPNSLTLFIAVAIAIALILLGLAIITPNKAAFEAYKQQQRNAKQLDTPKADPFYTEQLKTDKVKEQR